jgi:hypothetical protein
MSQIGFPIATATLENTYSLFGEQEVKGIILKFLFVSWKGKFTGDGERKLRDSIPTNLFRWGGVGIVRKFCFKMKINDINRLS